MASRGNKQLHYSDATSLAEALAHLCEDPQPGKDGWMACCPSHEDRTASLHITPNGNKALLHCFAGCPPDAILGALGLTLADLFVTPASPPRRISKIYDYYDARGALLHQTIRYEPKEFKQRRPDPDNPNAFIWNLKTIEPVLYALPAVMRAITEGTPVYLVEGEKDVETLQEKGVVATCNPMGAGASKWRQSYTKALAGAHVIILADYDTPGWTHANLIGAKLLGTAASIKIVQAFHTEEPGSDISDWIAAGGTRAEFEAIVDSTPFCTEDPAPRSDLNPFGWPHPPASTTPPSGAASATPASTPTPGRKIEQYRHLLPQVVAQAQDALLHIPGAPIVFQRARRLVTIAPAEKAPRGILRTQGTPIMSALTASRLRALLASAAAWVSPNTTHSKLLPDMPQPWVVETLLEQEDWDFPPLTGILNGPTMRPDGSLMLTQGYDHDTGLWLTWQHEQFPAVVETPSLQDAQVALQRLKEPFQDFPFAEPFHCTAAIAAVLSLLVRYTVQSVPLFAIRATTRGSGKTLLADCIAMIATGRLSPKMPQVKEEEEERKRLLALALDGDPMVVIDNVVGALGNPALDLAVTSQIFKDRLLGKNATKEAPLYTVFFATGNNMFFRGDMARRALPIDLAPLMENPETRVDFTHPRLLTWIQHERPRLISAALTLLRAYCVAGKPPQPIEAYGSFEAWSDLIRAALVWAGDPDPCLGRDGLEAASDETFEAHAELLAAWHACYGSAPRTLASIVGDIQQGMTPANTLPFDMTDRMKQFDCLRDALGFFDARFDGQRLNSKSIGKSLKRLCGRVIDAKRLIELNERSKYGKQWAVKEV